MASRIRTTANPTAQLVAPLAAITCAAKRFLSEKNLPYEEINLEDVGAAAEIVIQVNQGRRSAPTFDIDGQCINCSPFDRRKLSEAWGLS